MIRKQTIKHKHHQKQHDETTKQNGTNTSNKQNNKHAIDSKTGGQQISKAPICEKKK